MSAEKNPQLIHAKSELLEAAIKLGWELKAYKEIIDGATVEHIPALKDQSTRLQKFTNEIHSNNANLILNLTTAQK